MSCKDGIDTVKDDGIDTVGICGIGGRLGRLICGRSKIFESLGMGGSFGVVIVYFFLVGDNHRIKVEKM